MIRHRLCRSAALGLTLVAFTAPAAGAQQDLRSPDTRDSAAALYERQDLRSPDTRDVAAGRSTLSAPKVTVVRVTQPAPSAPTPASGIDWGDAAIGAGFAVVLGLIALGTLVAIRRGAIRRSTTTRIA
jgi:hypothetical protein